jgi:methylmalonyl-CoA mutase C-terminal domain/subunit
MSKETKIRVLLAKCGLDGHERGVKVVALGLRDEGMEVIYSGLRQTPHSVAKIAVQEDVDVVGLSCLSGAHKHHFSVLLQELKKAKAQDILVLCGGSIPEEDISFLKEIGADGVFGPGTPIKDIANFIKSNVLSSSRHSRKL